MLNSYHQKLVFRTSQPGSQGPGGPEVVLEPSRPRPGYRDIQACVSQTRLLTHSDGDIVVPIVLGDQGHHWPFPGWVRGVDRDELFSAVLGEPVHLDGVAHGVSEKEHFHLRGRAAGVWRQPQGRCSLPPVPRQVSQQSRAQRCRNTSSSPWAQPVPPRLVIINKQIIKNESYV